jgi:hypothetical protein
MSQLSLTPHPQGGGGKFEDTEKRDIAKGKDAVVRLLRDVALVPSDGTILDFGAGTGLLLRGLSSLVPRGQVCHQPTLGLEAISSIFCTPLTIADNNSL